MRSDDLHLTHHALEQTAARSITLEEVAQALDEPETTYSSPRREDRITLLGTTKSRSPSENCRAGADPTSLSPSPIEIMKGSLTL